MISFIFTPLLLLACIVKGYKKWMIVYMIGMPVGQSGLKIFRMKREVEDLREIKKEKGKIVLPDTPPATTIYGDFTVAPFRIFLIGTLQFTLMLLYSLGIWSAAYKAKYSGTEIMYYFIGTVVQLAYVFGTDVWSISFKRSITFWAVIWFVFNEEPDSKVYFDEMKETSRSELIIRIILHTFVHIIGLAFIMLAIPVQILTGTGTDTLGFVMGVVSAFFIVQIDDIYPKELTKSKQ